MTLDDQDFDPIAESLAAVQQQFAGETPDGADTLDASDQDDDQTSDDLEASETDEPTDELSADETDEEVLHLPDWSDPESPYHPQYQQSLQAHQRAEEAEGKREQARQFLNAFRTAKANEQTQAFVQNLQEIDPQLAQEYLSQRTGMVQQVQQAGHETVGYQHGMAALHLAMTDLLTPEQVAEVVRRGGELAAQPGLEQMQMTVQQRRLSATQKSQRELDLEQQNKVLRLQVAARQRDPNADRVDSSPARRGKITRPEDAKDMDEFFTVFKPFG